MSNMQLTPSVLEAAMNRQGTFKTMSMDSLPEGGRGSNVLWKVKQKLNLVETHRDELKKRIIELETQLDSKNRHLKELENYEAMVVAREKVAFGADTVSREEDDSLDEINRQLSLCVEYLKTNTKMRRYFSTMAGQGSKKNKKDKENDADTRKKKNFVPIINKPYRPKTATTATPQKGRGNLAEDARQQMIFSEHQRELKKLQTQVEEERRHTKDTERLLDIEKKRFSKLKAEYDDLVHSKKVANEEAGKTRGKLAKVLKDNETLGTEKKKLQARNSGMQNDLGPLEKANQSMTFQLREVDKEIERMNMQQNVMQKKMTKMADTERANQAKIKELQTMLTEKDEELTGTKVKLERKREKKRKYKQWNIKTRAELKEMQLTLSNERDKARQDFNLYNKKMKDLTFELEKMTNGYRKKAQDADICASEAEQNDRMKRSHERRMKEMQQEIDDLVVLLDRARGELQTLYNELDEKNMITEKLDDEVDETRTHAAREKKKVLRKLEIAEKEMGIQQKELHRLNKENATLQATLTRCEGENDSILAQLQRAHKFFNKEKMENEDNQQQLSALDKNLQKARLENEKLLQKIAKLDTQMRRMQEQLDQQATIGATLSTIQADGMASMVSIN